VSRLSIRARLTAAFAVAMVLVLAAAGLFVYLQLRADLDEGVDASLVSRADAVAASVAGSGGAGLDDAAAGALEDPEENLAQVLGADGSVVEEAGGASEPALTPGEVDEAATAPLIVERSVPGIEGTARVLARPLEDASSSGEVLAIGQSLEDRDETLSGLVTSFAIGGPVAVALASLIGYLLAAAGLRPVEAIRRRACEVSLGRGEERLPVPAAHDEVRRLGETLNEMLDRLRGSFERERRFVADASHELRTPVAVLKTELEGALRAGGHRPEVREALVAAVEECDHLAQLADDLLVVARAAEGGLPVRAEELRAQAVLEGVRRRFADRAEGRGRRIEVDAPDDLTLQADPQRMRQALGNLVDNALRYGEGEVTLSARAVDGAVAIDVADQGPGFDRDIASRAFERFTRGDSARTRGGSGLGMAIVHAVVEAHGGSAEIVPAEGGGRVRISLPQRGRDISPDPSAVP
jgi:signal transduction histidine kinase